MARRPDPGQHSDRNLLIVKDYPTWVKARELALEQNLSLSDVVEMALRKLFAERTQS